MERIQLTASTSLQGRQIPLGVIASIVKTGEISWRVSLLSRDWQSHDRNIRWNVVIKRIVNMKRFSHCFDLVVAIFYQPFFSVWHCCFFIIWLRFRRPSSIRCTSRHSDYKTVCLRREVLERSFFVSLAIRRGTYERHGNLLMCTYHMYNIVNSFFSGMMWVRSVSRRHPVFHIFWKGF